MTMRSMLAAVYKAANDKYFAKDGPALAPGEISASPLVAAREAPDLLLLSDAAVINHALKTPNLQDKAARDRLWHERYNNSADLQAEFVSAADYAAFMNADFAGRMHILRPSPGVCRAVQGGK
jgi:hypothetical protein